MPAINWDINLTTLLVFAASCIVFYIGVLRTGDRVRANQDAMTGLQKAVEEWKTSHLGLKSEFTILRDEVHQHYLPREDFEGAVDTLFRKIDDSRAEQIKAINRIDDRLLQFIADRQSPPRQGR